jgi:hypothetical protein
MRNLTTDENIQGVWFRSPLLPSRFLRPVLLRADHTLGLHPSGRMIVELLTRSQSIFERSVSQRSFRREGTDIKHQEPEKLRARWNTTSMLMDA